MRKLSVVLLGSLILLAVSCDSKRSEDPNIESFLTISSEVMPLRAFDASWEAGDQIGVFAVVSGENMTKEGVYNDAKNIRFQTKGDGMFRASGSSVRLKAGTDLDVYAYYPYSEQVTNDFRLPLDVSDQNSPAAIDLLYAKSATPASIANKHVALSFDHKLSQLVLTLAMQGDASIEDVQAVLDGTVVKGQFDIATGEVILGSYKSALSAKLLSANGGTASLSYLLLPGQTLSGATITFTVNGRRYAHRISDSEAVIMEGGRRYTYPFLISASDQLELLSDGAVIDPIEGDGSSDIDAHEEDDNVVTEALDMPANAEGGGSLKLDVSVDATSEETWSAVADKSFVKLTQSTTNGAGTLSIELEENPTYEIRTARVIITIVPKVNTTLSTRTLSTGKRTRVIMITQAAKNRPEAEANLMLLDASFANDLAPFVVQSVIGDARWQHSTYKGQAFAKISGYDSAAKRARVNEDWLVSPRFDMTGATIAKLTFEHAINYSVKMEEEATLYFSTNYEGDVKSASWEKAEIAKYPAANGWAFVSSGEILFPQTVLGKSRVHFAFKYISTESNASTWEINKVLVKADAGKVVGVTPTPDPDPNPNPGQPVVDRAHYMEIPIVNKNKMTDGLYHMHMAPDSYFKGGHTEGGKRRNYTLYIATNSRMPYWVAYPLYPDCMGGAKRTNAWNWDPDIPNEFQPDLRRSYSHGQDRGHMLASSARNASRELNRTTFYFTNMIPQYSNHNQQNWAQFENLEKAIGGRNDNDTVYVVTGPIFDPNTNDTCSDARGNQIPIPTYSWKVMLRYDRKDQKFYSIAVKIPNVSVNSRWQEHVTTVAALEQELGLTFFTHLPKEVADEVKNQKDLSNWK